MSSTNDYLSERRKGAEYDPDANVTAQYIDFVDYNGNFQSATLAAVRGPSAYTLVLPGVNPVDQTSDRAFVSSEMSGVNDLAIVAKPRVTTVNGVKTPVAPAVLDGRFMGLASGFYSDFVPMSGVPIPYEKSVVDGVWHAGQVNCSYFWQRIGDIVSLTGQVVIAGQANHDSLLKFVEMRLPIPLKETDMFAGTVTYISTHASVGSYGRDPRFFGQADMVCGQDTFADADHTEYNNFKMAVYPTEWTRDKFRIEWKAKDNGQNVKGATIRFNCRYSLAPIMGNGPTKPYIVDRVPTDVNPGNWTVY